MSGFVRNLAEIDGTARRKVYVLPNEMVERVRQYTKDKGIPSETEAVRRLLAKALDARGIASSTAKGETP